MIVRTLAEMQGFWFGFFCVRGPLGFWVISRNDCRYWVEGLGFRISSRMGKSLSHSRHVDLIKGTPADMQDKAEQDEARPDKTRHDKTMPHHTTLHCNNLQYNTMHYTAMQHKTSVNAAYSKPLLVATQFLSQLYVRLYGCMHACMYYGGPK